jgi:hypothetical protein
LEGVGDCCGEEDVVDFIGEEDNCFFPYHTAFLLA